MSGTHERTRWVRSGPATGAANMAIDESLLETVRDGGGPILRTYGWNPPTLSVGYGQDLAGIDLARCRELGIGIVRRPTGGRAVLHWEELTYCYLSLPPDGDDSIQQTYLTIGRCLQRGLQLFGVDVIKSLPLPVPLSTTIKNNKLPTTVTTTTTTAQGTTTSTTTTNILPVCVFDFFAKVFEAFDSITTLDLFSISLGSLEIISRIY